MPDFSTFTEKKSPQPTDYLIGYDAATPGGEKRFQIQNLLSPLKAPRNSFDPFSQYQTVVWYDGTPRIVGPNEYFERFSHYYKGPQEAGLYLGSSNGGSSTLGTNVLFNQRYYRDIGVVRLGIGTSTNGTGIVHSFNWGGTTGNVPVQRWGVGLDNFSVHRVIHKVCLDTPSDSTNRYTFIAGWWTSTDGWEPRSGIYFAYQDDINGGRWVCKCRKQSSSTVFNTSIAPVFITGAKLDHWQELMCEFMGNGNSGAGIVNFYLRDINGAIIGEWQLVGSISSNIPYDNGDFGQVIHPGGMISRLLGNTNDRYAYLDYFLERNFIV